MHLFHKWHKWSEPEEGWLLRAAMNNPMRRAELVASGAEDPRGIPCMFQQRTCDRCGKQGRRVVRGG